MKRITQMGVVSACLVLVPLLHAQGDRGALLGRVTDRNGAVLSGATITITNEETGVVATTISNGSGDYTAPPVNAGHYTVQVTAPGFESFKAEHVVVDVGRRIQVDASLNVGSAKSEVTVVADAQSLNTANAELGMTIEQKSITDLPLIYGNPFALEFLTPGISLSGVNPNIHVYDSGTATVSVNGSALNSLDYKLDGAPDNRVRYSAFTPSTEFVSQYRVSTATYDATQGHSSGGFVNTQLKSGTNRIHGSLFGYYQNPKINANTWQPLPDASKSSNTKPTFVREGFGIGLPIIKDKLFFFGGYEHSRQATPNVQTLSVPTAAERQGDFSALLALDTTAGAKTCGTTATTLTGTVNKYQLFNPLSATGTAGTRTCVPGNKLTSISPIATALYNYYPLPNLTTANTLNNYVYAGSDTDTYFGSAARVDYTISDRQSMYAHLLRSSRNQKKNRWFGDVSGTFLDYENYGTAVGYTRTLSPSTVLNGEVSYTRFTTLSEPLVQGHISPTTIGMPSYLTTGLPVSAQALPRVDLTGYTSATTATGVQSQDDIWMGNVSISKQLGGHFLRFGMEYRRYLTNGMSSSAEQGTYVSDGSQLTQAFNTKNSVGGVGYSVAMLEDGLIASGTQTQNSDFAVRSGYWAGFFHDDWRVTSKLTLNIGLRYEYESPDTERNGKEAVGYSFTAKNSATASASTYVSAGTASKSTLLSATINPVGGLIFANTNGYGNQPYTSQKWNFSPRLGFAYAVGSKTVLRGGYGIFFDSLNSFLLSGGNFGSTTMFLVPQIGYQSTTAAISPTYSATTGLSVATVANPFPAGLNRVTGNSLGTSTGLGGNIQFLQGHPTTPYNQRWSVGVQRQFGAYVVSIDYVGNHGVHQPAGQYSVGSNTGGREYNAIPRSLMSTVQGGYDLTRNNAFTTAVANPFYGVIPSSTSIGSSTTTVAQLVKPYPEYLSVNSFTMDGMSIYNALQAQIQRRYTNGFSLTASFTWSRTLDATQFLNPQDASPWYGTSTLDRPLRLATSGIYQLPWGHGRKWLGNSRNPLAQVVGGWQLQGVYQVQSGAPLEFDASAVYYGGDNPGNSHWSRSAYKNSIGSAGTANQGYWFNTSNWLQAASNSGNLKYPAVTCSTTSAYYNAATGVCGRALPSYTYQLRTMAMRYNNLRADRLNQADVGVQRQFLVYKFGTLQFRAEAINVLNHPVYTAPLTDPSKATFGLISSQANQPRVYQFSGFFRF